MSHGGARDDDASAAAVETAPDPASAAPRLFSFVIPCFNEAETVPLLRQRLETAAQLLPCPVEWVFVNDGSRDATWPLLASWARVDPRVKLVDLSRNFGHQAALTAGLDHARGEVVVMMDADLQDPPELAPALLAKHREGFDVVFAQRQSRSGETWFKRLTAAAFYRLMRVFVHPDLPADAGDFRLMTREVVDALRHMPERQRFLRGMVAWMGFRQAAVPFDRPPRVAGETKFGVLRMLRFAITAALSFTALPLRLAIYLGTLTVVFGALYGGYALVRALTVGDLVPGWATIVVLQCLIGGTILLCVGMVGEYVARIYEESKQRPLYLVRQRINCDPPNPPST